MSSFFSIISGFSKSSKSMLSRSDSIFFVSFYPFDSLNVFDRLISNCVPFWPKNDLNWYLFVIFLQLEWPLLTCLSSSIEFYAFWQSIILKFNLKAFSSSDSVSENTMSSIWFSSYMFVNLAIDFEFVDWFDIDPYPLCELVIMFFKLCNSFLWLIISFEFMLMLDSGIFTLLQSNKFWW